jgi:hypothetical protein
MMQIVHIHEFWKGGTHSAEILQTWMVRRAVHYPGNERNFQMDFLEACREDNAGAPARGGPLADPAVTEQARLHRVRESLLRSWGWETVELEVSHVGMF